MSADHGGAEMCQFLVPADPTLSFPSGNRVSLIYLSSRVACAMMTINKEKKKKIKQQIQHTQIRALLQENLFSGAEVIKLFFILNSSEHDISNAHKTKMRKKIQFFLFQNSQMYTSQKI